MKFHAKENAQSKSYDFAFRVVLVCQEIREKKKEYILTKQLIRSGTSVGVNLQEVLRRQSQKDLLHKLSISYKEARESRYWISLLYDSQQMSLQEKEDLDPRVFELLKILGASINTKKKRLGTKFLTS